jgi:hypothetical protein
LILGEWILEWIRSGEVSRQSHESENGKTD